MHNVNKAAVLSWEMSESHVQSWISSLAFRLQVNQLNSVSQCYLFASDLYTDYWQMDDGYSSMWNFILVHWTFTKFTLAFSFFLVLQILLSTEYFA